VVPDLEEILARVGFPRTTTTIQGGSGTLTLGMGLQVVEATITGKRRGMAMVSRGMQIQELK
jgi:hypothetical protein